MSLVARLCYILHMEIRQYFKFTGCVQGVGFRSTAQSSARAFGLSGWVRNCADGSVEMEAQGSEAKIAAMLKALRDNLFASIDRTECKTIPLLPDERGFRVRF